MKRQTKVAKASPAKTKLEPVLVYGQPIPDEKKGLWMAKDGGFYLRDGSGSSPVKVTATEALEWYLRCEKFEKDSSGNMVPVIKAALNQSANPTQKVAGDESPEAVIKTLDHLGEKDYTVSIPLTLWPSDWFYIRLAASNNKMTMGELVSYILRNSDELLELSDAKIKEHRPAWMMSERRAEAEAAKEANGAK